MDKKAIKEKLHNKVSKLHPHFPKVKNIKSLNYYIITFVALSFLLLAALFTNGFEGATNLVAFLNKGRVGAQTIKYINENNMLYSGYTASLSSIKIAGHGLYQLGISISDGSSNSTPQIVNTYVTMDGKIFVTGFVDMSQKSTDTNSNIASDISKISKADKATAQLFVMAFCPYGNQAETAMKPVYDLLKNDATITLRYIVSKNSDGSYSSLHGDQELNEDVRELCVQKYQPTKFWDFMSAINDKTTSANVDSLWEGIAADAGVDVSNVKTCVANEKNTLLDAEIAVAEKYQVSSSPTIIINDMIFEADRTAEGFKTAICAGFKSEPASCSTSLSESSPTTSGSCN